MATKRVQIGVTFMTPQTVYVAPTSGASPTTAISAYTPVVGAPITIVDRNTGNAPTVYSTETGSSTLGSLTTDNGGLVDGWVVEGSYTITAGKVGSFAGASIGWEAVRGDGVENIFGGAVVVSSLAQEVVNLLVPTGTILDFAGSTAPSDYVFCDGAVYPIGSSGSTYYNLAQTLGTTWNTGSEGSGNFRVPDFRGLVAVGQSANGAGSGQPTYSLSTHALGPRSKQPSIAGFVGGEEYHTLSQPELAPHSHGITDKSHGHGPGRDASTFYTNDPGHGHSAWTDTQLGGLIVPTSSSGWGDLSAAGGGLHYAPGSNGANVGSNGIAHGHNVGIGSSGTGVWLNYSGTGITNTDGMQSNNGGSAHNNMQPYAGTTKIIKL